MMKQKTPQEVLGYQMRCPNFAQCPLCYGCRNYDEKYIKCVMHCGKDTKKNVCNTTKHQEHLLAKMIVRDKIKI